MTEQDEPLDPREEALSRALHAHADTVRPAGDGLTRIRARVQRRRVRNRWLAPTASAAAVAATVTAVVASGLVTGGGSGGKVAALAGTPLASSSTSAAVTRTATVASKPTAVTSASRVIATTPAIVRPVETASPTTTASATSVLPSATFTVAADSPVPGTTAIWPAANATTGWVSPVDTAEQFVTSLHLPTGSLSASGLVRAGALTADVAVSETNAGSSAPVVLGVVHLSRTTPIAFWRVLSMSNANLAITSPLSGETVGSPLQIGFSLAGGTVDSITASAWTSTGVASAASTESITSRSAAPAGGTLMLSPTASFAGPGYVVLADEPTGSLPTVTRIAVTPVTFPATTATITGPTYVAVIGGKIGLYDANNGTLIHPIAATAMGVTEVQVSDDQKWVYYLRGSGCGATLMRTPLDGSGTPTVVPTTGGSISSFGLAGADGQNLTYLATDCHGGWTLHWRTASGSGQFGAVSSPPVPESLAISPDGSTIAAFIEQGGQQGDVTLFATASAKSLADGTLVTGCGQRPGECLASDYAADGDLFYFVADGAHLTVYQRHQTTAAKLFQVAGSFGGTISVDPTGTKVLLTDGAGQGWSWDGSGAAKALPSGVTDAAW